MSRRQMHISHMNLRNLAHDMDIEVDFGWGALLFDTDIQAGEPIRHAGAYVRLPDDFDMTKTVPDSQCIIAPAGTYVCMNVYAMPYDTSFLGQLYQWIREQNYTVNGNLVNECILDTTFYTKERQTDFCQLQVPILLPENTDKQNTGEKND